MLALKYLLMLLGVGLFGSAGALVVYDVYVSERLRRLIKRNASTDKDAPVHLPALPLASVRWKQAQQLAAPAKQPDLGRTSRHVVSGSAHRNATDR